MSTEHCDFCERPPRERVAIGRVAEMPVCPDHTRPADDLAGALYKFPALAEPRPPSDEHRREVERAYREACRLDDPDPMPPASYEAHHDRYARPIWERLMRACERRGVVVDAEDAAADALTLRYAPGDTLRSYAWLCIFARYDRPCPPGCACDIPF